jgi:hypothetical protein
MKKTEQPRTLGTERAVIDSTIAWISRSRKIRAGDAWVILINQFGQGKPRSVVVRTTGLSRDRDFDLARCQKLSRRLRAIGVTFTTSSRPGRMCDGIFGTEFAYYQRSAEPLQI